MSTTSGSAGLVSAPAEPAAPAGLPERAHVGWRRQVDEAVLRRDARHWTLSTLGHTVPFTLAAIGLTFARPVLGIIGLILLLHAWVIPDLYARRGAAVMRERPGTAAGPEARALLLLGDLVDDANRRLHEVSNLVLQPGRFGCWVVGEAGALLVRPGGRRVNCYCVRVTGEDLPHGDRIAHLLLALRCEEADFATVANCAFSGARWRVRRRLPVSQRIALDAAVRVARGVTPASAVCARPSRR